MVEFDDPLGVFERYSEEQRQKLKENMYAPLLDVQTEWEDGQVRWDCPECEESTYTDKFYGTKRCDSCMKMQQSENWSVGEVPPNPEEKEPEQQSARSW